MTKLHPLLEQHRPSIEALCKAHHVKRLYAFGSITRDDFTPESDVDLLYTFNYEQMPLLDAADNFFDFYDRMQTVFERKVDLVSETGIRNPYLRASIDQDKILLYEAYS